MPLCPRRDLIPVAEVTVGGSHRHHDRSLSETEVALVDLAGEDPVFDWSDQLDDARHVDRVLIGLRRITKWAARERPYPWSGATGGDPVGKVFRILEPVAGIYAAAKHDGVVAGIRLGVIRFGDGDVEPSLAKHLTDVVADFCGGAVFRAC